ncbi:hypothetical protein POSPLADRAFT_1071598 [Postia placenta MAD-698-R-SB12]|uniref:Uncharacterized protein n=1 Tax=Postia placenta MAD-698-R-SB12 TaxID=670580 RepID=A0A1X6MMY4_9APHY|nr:hypothetical protein POSPLADRAFT_1071598 [Postia placenta MAD-698-R-SB12]OSX57688.1 hypothetical protein POSPLADRAFT_1071598 [Postia placenta MAD-698-R-SB12]
MIVEELVRKIEHTRSGSTMSYLGYNVSQNEQSFQRDPSSSPIMHRPAIPSGSSGGGPTPFKAPAHKHAHHLHSIPPREKSTRTLIIDHLLWVHARTRFAQARAELGMTDRTGGPSTANYAHRERPESYEEDEEVYSDGEDVSPLTARAGGPGHTHGDEEDERLDMQDLILARALRQRAESVEKVATGMLDQPPELPPLHPDDLIDPPTSPQLRPQHVQRQHILPNGVRLRLALATVINDLFSRRAPIPRAPSPLAPSETEHPPSAHPNLPSPIIPLAAISSGLQPPNPNSSTAHRRPYPSQYIRSLYDIGTDPETQNSPPSLRCPRHLHMGCEICVEAKSPVPTRGAQPRGRSVPGRASSTTGSSPGDPPSGQNCSPLVGGVTGWQDGSGIGSGLARPGPQGTVLRRPSDAQVPSRLDGSPQMCSTKLSELIVRFMRLSALVAMELGREATEERASVDGGDGRRDEEGQAGTSPSGLSHAHAHAARAPVSPQISPRTLTQRNLADAGLYYYALRPSREWYFLLAGLLTRAICEGYMTAGWRGIEPLEVLLGVGLGINPAFGRRSRNRGQARENGQGGAAEGSARQRPEEEEEDEEEDEFKQFDPDDLPELEEATRVLFPSLRDPGVANGMHRREGAELEYEIEMVERLQRFYDVPQSTPDVATHMEDLQWQFPAEAVERAAVRFCEAIARWRGKPELETYKKATWIIRNGERRASAGAAMSIDALVHSNPTSPSNSARQPAGPARFAHQAESRTRKPLIEKYFAMPQAVAMQGRKRRRSETDRMQEDGRRMQNPPIFG